ncbi:putative reverse transcriptase domain-containing protein [Tanacetum coccineum]
MAAPVIPILSDSSNESVGSHVPRVILFVTIPTNIPVIPVVPAEVSIVPVDSLVALEVGVVSIISPIGVLDLVDYLSSFDSDPSKDSLPLAPKVASRSSSPSRSSPHDTLAPSSEFPLAPVVPHPGFVNGQRFLSDPRVGPFPCRRLAWRRVSHRSLDRYFSPDFTSDSSSSSSSLNSSLDISPGQSHSGPSTRVASPRLVYPLVMTPRCSEAFKCWRSTLLSTLYPPMTSESSLDSSSKRSLDSFSPSTGPSCKRCRSLTTLVPSSTPVSRSIASTLVDLLLPRKRFRDSYSLEYSREEHIEISTTDVETDIDLGIGDGVRAHTKDDTGMGVEVATSDIREDKEEFKAEASAGGMIEIVEEFCQIRRDRDDTQRRLRRTMTNTRFGMTPTAIEEMINRRMSEALETCEANRNIRLGNSNDEGGNRNSNGNGNGGGNGNGNHNENDIDARPVVRECIYQDFMKCQPLNFKGTEGFVGLIRWFEKMETVFHISNCLKKYQRELMKLMAEVYYPRTEIQKIESKLWNLTMKNNNLADYTQRFQELTMLCTKMVPEEEDRVEKFIGGLPDNIQGNLIAYGRKGHYRSDGPKLKDHNRGNKTGNKSGIGKARGKAYVLGGADVNPDSNVITGTFLFNNHYAYVLFDSGVDRSFVSTTFSTLLDIIPDTLNVSCAVELPDERFLKLISCLEAVC